MRDQSKAGLWLVVLLLAMAVTGTLFWKTTPARPFFYDEADYMYAGTRGFAANYLDVPSISPVEFVRKGLELSRDKTKRFNLSQFIRSSGDITFYRHYHGPVYAYWIALWHALGTVSPGVYRASGLFIHLCCVLLVFWIVRRAFPSSPPVAAFAAALALLLNRTALVAATSVTQHGMFSLTAALALFLAALFFRSKEDRLWYAACTALGLAFSTVETSFILVAVFVVLLAIVGLQAGWAKVPRMLGRGILFFLLGIALVWPKGVFELSALKGYGYLAYIAIYRKTFSPIGPGQLWTFKFTTYPEEFIVPALALLAAAVFWKRFEDRQSLVPFIMYALTFVAVTMVITAPYTYYHVSLMMALSVITGVVFGSLWNRLAPGLRILLALLLAGPLLWMPVRYYRETEKVLATHDARAELLAWVNSGQANSLIVPYVLVPTLHFYHPERETASYDVGVVPAELADQLEKPNHALLCEQPLCQSVRGLLPPGSLVTETPVMAADPDVQSGPLYALEVQPPNR